MAHDRALLADKGESMGKAKLYDDKMVAEGPMTAQPGEFKGGAIFEVEVDVCEGRAACPETRRARLSESRPVGRCRTSRAYETRRCRRWPTAQACLGTSIRTR